MNKNISYRVGLVETINKYAPYLSFAVTLTMKQYAKVKVRRFSNWDRENNEFWLKLNSDIALDTLNYFNARLTHFTYGKDARKTSTKYYSQPLIIGALEGIETNKNLHWHLAVGNIATINLYEANYLIAKAWSQCDFANKQIKVKQLTNTYGWLDYMAKETNVGNIDVVRIENIKQPQSIQQLVGAESSYS